MNTDPSNGTLVAKPYEATRLFAGTPFENSLARNPLDLAAAQCLGSSVLRLSELRTVFGKQ